MKNNDIKNFECKDCHVNTLENNEYYMVHDKIWIKAKMKKGMLCIGCIEKRLKRKLTTNDFTEYPINKDFLPKSKRLLNRLNN